MSDRVMEALCCVCGAVRTCRRPRNHQGENWWLSGPVGDWSRELGDLKCHACGEVTRHALITGSDHTEKIHKMAIGWEFRGFSEEEHQRVRDRWREGLPQNPILKHQWWVSDETAARKAGETHVITICKTYTPLPTKATEPGTGVDRDEFMEPRQYGLEEGYEDPETGLTWLWMTCPDCYLRSNAIALDEQRKALKDKLLDVAARFSTLDARTVERLLAQFTDSEESA